MNRSTLQKSQLLLLLLCFTAFSTLQAQSFGGLVIESKKSCNGKTISVTVKTDSWSNVVLTQYAIGWDPAVLQYVDHLQTNPTFSDQQFGDADNVEGYLTTSWYDQAISGGISPQNEIIFVLTFNVVGQEGDLSSIGLKNPNGYVTEFYYDNNGITTDYSSTASIVEGEISIESPKLSMESINNSLGGNPNGSISVTPYHGTAPYSLIWSNGETGGTTISNLAPGEYYCTISDANTCSTNNGPYVVESTPSATKDIDGLNTFLLTPNPASDVVNINVAFAKNENTTVRILNVAGKVLYQNNQEGNAFSMDVSVADFTNGMYFVEIGTQEGTAIEKLIVAK